jgi:hypothetical protein
MRSATVGMYKMSESKSLERSVALFTLAGLRSSGVLDGGGVAQPGRNELFIRGYDEKA